MGAGVGEGRGDMGGGEKGLRQKRNKKWKKIGAESLENRSKKPQMSVIENAWQDNLGHILGHFGSLLG